MCLCNIKMQHQAGKTNGKEGESQDSDTGMHNTVLMDVELLLEMSGGHPVRIIPRCTCACLILVICRVDGNLSERHNTA